MASDGLGSAEPEPVIDASPVTEPAAEGGAGKPKKAEPKPEKPAATKKSRAMFVHPPYFDMIVEAISAMKEKNGSSQYAIAKFMENKHKDNLPTTFRKLLLYLLKKFTTAGKLIKVKNSYKLPPGYPNPAVAAATKPKPKPAASTKPKAAAASKGKGAKAKPAPAAKSKPSAAAKPKSKAASPAAKSKTTAPKPKSTAHPSKTTKTSAKDSPGKKKVAPAKKGGAPAKNVVPPKKAIPAKKAATGKKASPAKTKTAKSVAKPAAKKSRSAK